MSVLDKFKSISAFVFDVDGVLTDGTVLVLDGGLQARRMHIRDGFALQMAQQNGYKVKIISGGNSPEVKDRLDKLGIQDVSMSVLDKGKILDEFMATQQLERNQVLYMGDDLPDIPAMGRVGLACCPADAASEVKEAAQYISAMNGGSACVRDVIEKVLKLNGHWNYKVEIPSK